MKREFFNGERYHIFNRGTEKRKIFLCEKDYLRFLKSISFFNDRRPAWKVKFEVEPRKTRNSSIVEIICYCLNPNHFHLILEQREEGGISKFMQKLLTGYTMYFNKKYDRSGSLFQGKFKSVFIVSNEQLLYLSAYVNKNYFIHGYNRNSKNKNWQFSSLDHYLGKRQDKLCNSDIILSQFKNNFSDYKKFCENSGGYSRERKDFANYFLE